MKTKHYLLKTLDVKKLILLVLVTISVGFFYAYPITFTQQMIDELGGEKRWTLIVLFIGLYVACRIIGCVFDYLNNVVSRIISNNMVLNLKRLFLNKYYSISSEYIYNEKFEKIYALYENDISTVANGICGPILFFASSVSLFIWSSITLVSIRWELALVYVITAVFIVFITLKAGNSVKKLQADKRKTEEKKLYLSKSSIEQYMKILIMRYDDKIIEQSIDAENEYNTFVLKETKISGAKTLINDILYYFSGACVWLIGSLFILKGKMTTGEIVAFISFAGLIISPIVRFSSQWISIQKILVSKKRIDDFLSLSESEFQQEKLLDYSRDSLVFDNVSFSYNKEQPLIQNLSHTFVNGKIYCISGENGSGKSTLFKLICRIYNSYGGKILYAGNDIRKIPKKELFDLIAYEDDSPIIIYGSLLDNLTLGIQNYDKNELDYLCKKIGLFDSLGELYSFETVLDKGGKQLSNGQRQMIGIIRSILSHKKIFILDETLSGIAHPIVSSIFDLYEEYCVKYNSIMLFVSHNKEYQQFTQNKVEL